MPPPLERTPFNDAFMKIYGLLLGAQFIFILGAGIYVGIDVLYLIPRREQQRQEQLVQLGDKLRDKYPKCYEYCIARQRPCGGDEMIRKNPKNYEKRGYTCQERKPELEEICSCDRLISERDRMRSKIYNPENL